ncbi:uncharacterized protein LOC143294641 [Babylonia areolata]|uniref:uncharacterized protein LOC143294641 n=1 Tax=Babylonia areolata TaxID=304850 RepID=UPI003FD188F1
MGCGVTGADVKTTGKKHRLFNFAYLQAKISSVGIRSLVDEAREARQADAHNPALEQLGMALQLAQDALKYDPKQLPSQLLTRITQPHEDLLPLLERCRDADLFLLPNQSLVTPPGGQLVHTISEHNDNIACMTMTSDGKYVITCSVDGVMVITDVHKGKYERKIMQIGLEPQNVFICCDDNVVVTATEKHLIAHTLETGAEAWKLKGDVFEDCPPCMCFAGDGQDTMVIFDCISVLLYEAGTGKKLEEVHVPQTRKFGIDFDSSCLLACGRNEYAVAVDGAQISLTRVNLKDKTIVTKVVPTPENQEDEDMDNLYIEALALVGSGDELCAIYSTMEDKDLVFMDVKTMNVIKTYKGDQSVDPANFHVTPDDRYLIYPKDFNGVFVWDLQNARLCTILPKVIEPVDVMTMDMNLFVTISCDRNIRIWDLSQEGQSSPFHFQDRAVTKMENGQKVVIREGEKDEEENEKKIRIRQWFTTENPRYVLLVVEAEGIQFMHVFDVATNTVVRKMKLGTKVSVSHFQGSRILVEVDRRLRLVDMDKMEVVTVFRRPQFQGCLNRIPIRGGKELLVPTKSGYYLKIYDTATGEVTRFLMDEDETPKRHYPRIRVILVSKDSSVAIAWQSGWFTVFDLTTHKFKWVIGEELASSVPDDRKAAITDDGRYFVYATITDKIKETDIGRFDQCINVYDLHCGRVVRTLMDRVTALKYTVEKGRDLEKTCEISSLRILDSTTILVAHEDNIIRVYNMHSGELLHRLEGHRYIPELSVRDDTPVFLSWVTSTEERSVKMWRKSDFTPLASFTSDTTMEGVTLLPGHGGDFLAFVKNTDTPVIFSVQGHKAGTVSGNSSPLSSWPQLYEGSSVPCDAVLSSDKAVFGVRTVQTEEPEPEPADTKPQTAQSLAKNENGTAPVQNGTEEPMETAVESGNGENDNVTDVNSDC